MKKIILLTLIITCLSSCLSTKKTNYFQGEPQSESDLYEFNSAPYRLQVSDVLSIDIKSENEELVTLFKTQGSVGNSATSESGLYFNGYTVDNHGNIRIPYIGELNVLGYTEREVREKVEEELETRSPGPNRSKASMAILNILI